jgi:hypothetical protein
MFRPWRSSCDQVQLGAITTRDKKGSQANLPPLLRSLGSQITPLAARTFQYTKEQLGQAEDKVRGQALAH